MHIKFKIIIGEIEEDVNFEISDEANDFEIHEAVQEEVVEFLLREINYEIKDLKIGEDS